MNDLLNLNLSHWNCKSQNDRILVPADLVRQMKPYHYDPIRFLYKCYKNNLGGAILNQSNDMGFPIQIAAFLNAVSKTVNGNGGRILVLADEVCLGYWYYHLTEHSKWKVTLGVDESSNPCISLLAHSDENKLKSLENHNFSIVVIDDFERMAKKVITRKLVGQFKIGLTHRNFVKFPDQRLQWTMLRWSNCKHFGTFESFCERDNECLESLSEPFAQFWQRRTWSFYDDCEKNTDEEIEEYTRTVRKWLEEKNFPVLAIAKSMRKSKRASTTKNYESENGRGRNKIRKRQPEFECADSGKSADEVAEPTKEENITKKVAMENFCDGTKVFNSNNEQDDVLLEDKFCAHSENMGGLCDEAEDSKSDNVLSFLFEDKQGGCKSEADEAKESVSDTTCNYNSRNSILSELFD